MNALIDAALRYSRTVLSLLVVILAVGVMSWLSIPKEAEPDVSVPTLYVSVGLEGIAPEDSERLLLRPLETELQGLDGLEKMVSTGYLGGGNIVLEFGASFDVDRALDDARNAVDKAKPNLPSEADDPTVSEVNVSELPIITLAVFGDLPEQALLQLMKRLQDRIEALPEVLEADLQGSREEVVEILIDPSVLQSYGLNIQEVLGLVAGSNRLIAAGTLSSGSGSFDLKVPGLFEDIEDIFDLPVKSDGESVVLFSDIADVRPTFKDPDSFARVNGKRTMSLAVKKRTGENIIETIAATRAIVEEERKAWPAGLEVKYLQDKSVTIKTMLGDLTNNVLAAVLLVLVIAVGALGLRSGLLVGFAIPGSFLIGFMVLAVLGFTINIVVLFSLILASGMLVDGAIVVIEYADRRLAEGASRLTAYTEASKRMAWPIIASTATTLAAFAPLAFWPGIIGEFMGYLPKTLLITLSASLAMALIFVPVLGAALETVVKVLAVVLALVLTIAGGANAGALIAAGSTLTGLPLASYGWVMPLVVALTTLGSVITAILFARFAGAMFDTKAIKSRKEAERASEIRGPVKIYAGILSALLKNPITTIVAIFAFMAVILVTYINAGKSVEFFPNVEPENMTVTVRARGNMSVYERDAMMRQVEERILAMQREHGEFNAIYAVAQMRSSPGAQQAEDTIGSVQLELVDYFNRRKADEIKAEIRNLMADIPGMQVELAAAEAGPPQGKAVQIEITATDVRDIAPAARHVLNGMTELGGYRDIEDGLPLPGIEWELTVDREQAALYGVDIAILGYYVRLITNGVTISTYRPTTSDDEVDISLRLPPQYRNLAQLDQLRVDTPKGQVPLSLFLKREPKPKVSQLQRLDGERAQTIKADIVDIVDGEPVTKSTKVEQIRTWIEENPLPGSARAKFVGEDEEMAETGKFLGQAFGVALFIMAVILITQFNSFYSALLILSAIFMSSIGVLLGLYLTGRNFSVVMTGVGLISLAGIVVNNNIVLIDTFEQLKRKGLTIHETLVLTATQRLRPILLTTVTTVLGLMPMVTGVNIDFVSSLVTVGAPSGQWWQSLATTIAFGLTFASFLTLFFTPCALKLQYDLRRITRLPAEDERAASDAGLGQEARLPAE
jgi:multidrug efflux pump